MSEILNAPATKQDQQRALRAEIDRSMALVAQALADKAFLKENPHIGDLVVAAKEFAAKESPDPERQGKTTGSILNLVLTQNRTRDIPARQLDGQLADEDSPVRSVREDAYLFPDKDAVEAIGKVLFLETGTLSPADISEKFRTLETVVGEIRRRSALAASARDIQATDPLAGQTLDAGYQDPLKGQTLLDETEIAAARTASQREALKLCIDAMSDATFREQNPGFVRVMDAIERFSRSRVHVKNARLDAQELEEYQGALCHFFLTRKDKIAMREGLQTPVTPETEAAMMRAIEDLGTQIPARRNFQIPPVELKIVEKAEPGQSPRAEAKAAAALGDGRVLNVPPPSQEEEAPPPIVLKTETPDLNHLDCIRHFPQLVGRGDVAQDTARNEGARRFVNGALSIEVFRDVNPQLVELAKTIEGHGNALAARISKSIEEPDPQRMETKAFFAARKERNDRIQAGKNGLVGALWGALLLDGQNGKFRLPTPKQTELALAFLDAPGLSARPVTDENGTITGYESRGASSPTAKLLASLNPAFESLKTGKKGIEDLKHGAAEESELRALETEILGIIDTVLSSDTTPDPDLSAATASGDDGVALPVVDGDAIAAARQARGEVVSARIDAARNIVTLRPKGDGQSVTPTMEGTGRVSGIFARAAAVVLAVGTMFGIGGDVQKDTVAAAEKPASWISSAFNFFRGAASSPVAPAYAAKEQESSPAPKP